MREPHVVCVGLATLDTILAVPRLPKADGRVLASELVQAGGGPAATAAVTLARLGARVHFVGAVGSDDAGRAVKAELEAEGVDVSELAVVKDARSPQSTILVHGDTRTIVHVPGTAGLELSARARELCHGAAWVHVDHVGYAVVPREARVSIDGGNPIDGLDLEGVALYAPTERTLAEQFGDAQGALAAGAALVVVTRGAAGSVAYTTDGVVADVPSPPVEPVSTLGAGDVFHGALLAKLLEDAPLEEALTFANTCAALSCRALDGRSAIPTLDEVAA
jgi:sugar/nucleoside kinase (ribokinase family)